jgi:hypothetical protein
MDGLWPRDQDRGRKDLLTDPGTRDLLNDAKERDLSRDPGLQDLVRDLGICEALRLGVLPTERLPNEARLAVSPARSGGFALPRRASRPISSSSV